MENRVEKAEKLKAFAVGQFHNHFALKSDIETKQKAINATKCVKNVHDIYCPRRKYKRKDSGAEDEKTRVRITLLEYGNKGLPMVSSVKSTPKAGSDERTIEDNRDIVSANEVTFFIGLSLLLPKYCAHIFGNFFFFA